MFYKGHMPPRKKKQLSLFDQQLKDTKKSMAMLKIKNALTDVLGLGAIGGTTLSQDWTLYKNLRWYLISNNRSLLSEMYAELGLIQTIVDIPVEDALRGGIDIFSKQMSPDEIANLQVQLKSHNDIEQAKQAFKWTRLYGGGGILIITTQDPTTPLSIDAINPSTPLEFRGIDMWEMFFGRTNTNETSVQMLSSEAENVEQLSDSLSQSYNYYGEKVDISRILKLNGITAPSFLRPKLRGWGMSVVESLIRSINQYLKSTDLSFEVLDEFKLDIFKIKGLVESLAVAGGAERVKQRIDLANRQKNFQNALTMDKEDEYDQKQLSWAGLGEIMQQNRMQIASDMRIPMTKLFGQSAAGFNSGEDDIEVYNAMIESSIRSKIQADLLTVVKLRCKQVYGVVPTDLEIEFKPLRVLSGEQEQNVRTQKFSNLLQARQAGEITSQEFRDGCNKDHLLGIQLSEDIDNATFQEPTETD